MRRAGRVIGLVLVAALVWGVPRAAGQPNPYGAATARTDVVVHADGSYTATLTQRQELVRPFDLVLGGAVHDGFRLPDAGTGFAPYLRAAYAVESATLDGAPVALQPEVDRHRVALSVARDEAPAGVHTLVLVYRVTGAALPRPDGVEAYVRPLAVTERAGVPDVAIRTDAGGAARVTGIACVAYAPDRTPCGSTADGAAEVDVTDPLTDVVAEIRMPEARVPVPRLDRS